jgi:hypothetical protein
MIYKQSMKMKYDVFISSPIASLDNEEQYMNSKDNIENLKLTLSDCDAKRIFYVGDKIKNFGEFSEKDISLKTDYNSISSSKHFIFLYPHNIATSALVEIGFAISKGLSILIFTKDKKILPFILQQADTTYNNIKIYECENMTKIEKLFKEHGMSLFPSIYQNIN